LSGHLYWGWAAAGQRDAHTVTAFRLTSADDEEVTDRVVKNESQMREHDIRSDSPLVETVHRG